jgi:hypothetical protein
MSDYRAVAYPLNVFLHVIEAEEGSVSCLHYGLFEDPSEPMGRAQERSTDLLLEELPAPGASLLDVGIGLGSTLARLRRLGYAVEGITPDPSQIAHALETHGPELPVTCVRFEEFRPGRRFDAVFFQESSQYIGAPALFKRSAELTGLVIVVDEFSLRPLEFEGALHRLDEFKNAAERQGFRLAKEIDISEKVAPTVDYFLARIPRYRPSLVDALGVTPEQLHDLMESGRRYRALYDSGAYGYRLLRFER